MSDDGVEFFFFLGQTFELNFYIETLVKVGTTRAPRCTL